MLSNPEAEDGYNMMVSSSAAAATEDTSAKIIIKNMSRSLEDGGSSIGLTQGEIIFVTLACFVVVIASIFAIYSMYKKRKQAKSARQNNNITSPAVMSPTITIGNGSDQYPATNVGNSMLSRESIARHNNEERNRRATVDTVDSTGGKKSRRSSTGSAGSNVSNQYKVAAINQMRRMSDLAEP
eukprot:scaffold177_cov113-Skeletonema_dohrnii-CCMP3373.AAC.5